MIILCVLYRKIKIIRIEVNNISWVLEFVKNIPDFLLYVVPGYLFIITYRYVLSKDENNSSETAHLLLGSLIASFILKTIYDVIIYNMFKLDWAISSRLYLMFIFAFCILCGFCWSKLVLSSCAEKIENILRIKRTVNKNIWRDILKDSIWVVSG